ncbi:hypothetical protein SEVIR_5G438250v4 [Setaria viridis]
MGVSGARRGARGGRGGAIRWLVGVEWEAEGEAPSPRRERNFRRF